MHRLLYIAMLLVACGCGPAVKMTGFAQEEKREYSGSFRHETQRSINEYAVPVAGVEVYMALDEEGTQPIRGTSCMTGPDGAYHVLLQSLPETAKRIKRYYMIAKKPGYHTFSQRFPTGALGLESTDVLIMAREAE